MITVIKNLFSNLWHFLLIKRHSCYHIEAKNTVSSWSFIRTSLRYYLNNSYFLLSEEIIFPLEIIPKI